MDRWLRVAKCIASKIVCRYATHFRNVQPSRYGPLRCGRRVIGTNIEPWLVRPVLLAGGPATSRAVGLSGRERTRADTSPRVPQTALLTRMNRSVHHACPSCAQAASKRGAGTSKQRTSPRAKIEAKQNARVETLSIRALRFSYSLERAIGFEPTTFSLGS